MATPDYIETKLINRLNANDGWREVKNNRIHYWLIFRKPVGFDWVERQVQKASDEASTELEWWEIHPHHGAAFAIEVREVNRREGIDDNQRGLTSFE